jgi:hypothetical protein
MVVPDAMSAISGAEIVTFGSGETAAAFIAVMYVLCGIPVNMFVAIVIPTAIPAVVVSLRPVAPVEAGWFNVVFIA